MTDVALSDPRPGTPWALGQRGPALAGAILDKVALCRSNPEDLYAVLAGSGNASEPTRSAMPGHATVDCEDMEITRLNHLLETWWRFVAKRVPEWASFLRGVSHPTHLANLHAVLMIALTAIIAWSAWQQTKQMRVISEKQIQVMAEQLRLAREIEDRQTQSALTVTSLSHSFGELVSGETTEFVGVTVANVSTFDVTITGWSIEVGIPEESDNRMIIPLVDPATEFKGQQLTDLVSLPHRLRRGDVARVLFRLEDMIALQRQHKSRLRIAFRDSLGNTHRLPTWVEWTEDATSSHNDPGPGLLMPEEKEAKGREPQ